MNHIMGFILKRLLNSPLIEMDHYDSVRNVLFLILNTFDIL